MFEFFKIKENPITSFQTFLLYSLFFIFEHQTQEIAQAYTDY